MQIYVLDLDGSIAHTGAMTILFSILGILAVAGIATSLVTVARDGYRRVPQH